jgi:hypothetical protein
LTTNGSLPNNSYGSIIILHYPITVQLDMFILFVMDTFEQNIIKFQILF